jgi:hypothetical protein
MEMLLQVICNWEDVTVTFLPKPGEIFSPYFPLEKFGWKLLAWSANGNFLESSTF